MTAGQELRRLVEADLVEQQGIGRWTSYRLKLLPELPEQLVLQSEEDKILVYVRQSGSMTNTDCRGLLSVNEARAYYLLKKLCEVRRLRPEGKGKGRGYVLP
jgi:predicted HTH transcriptional regulator